MYRSSIRSNNYILNKINSLLLIVIFFNDFIQLCTSFGYIISRNHHQSTKTSNTQFLSSPSSITHYDTLTKEKEEISKEPAGAPFSKNNEYSYSTIPEHIPKLSDIIQQYNAEPWKANAKVSRIIQGKLKSLASKKNEKGQYSMANEILSTVLSSPTKCNEMNVVYAITLCAKIVSDNKNDCRLIEFIEKMREIINILHGFVINDQLSSRQLANVGK